MTRRTDVGGERAFARCLFSIFDVLIQRLHAGAVGLGLTVLIHSPNFVARQFSFGLSFAAMPTHYANSFSLEFVSALRERMH